MNTQRPWGESEQQLPSINRQTGPFMAPARCDSRAELQQVWLLDCNVQNHSGVLSPLRRDKTASQLEGVLCCGLRTEV